MTWQLKPESKIGAYAAQELFDEVIDGAAPVIDFDGASDNDKEFEDVFPSDDNEEIPLG